MSQRQTALLVTEIGQHLSKATRPIPEPKDGEVLVKITVAGLNPHDAKSRDDGLSIKGSLPAVLASDITGHVVRVGPNVTHFKQGDHIFGQALLAITRPPGYTDAELATLPTNLVTAAVALFDSTGLNIPSPLDTTALKFNYEEASILIVGGGSNTGRFAIQLAAITGIGKIIVVASLNGEADLKALGATHVIDRTNPGTHIAADVKSIVGDDSIYALDTINAPEDQYIGVEALSNTKTGKFARLRPRGPVDESKLSAKKPLGFETLNILGASNVRTATSVPLWERVSGLVAEGKIKPTSFKVIKGLDLDKANMTLDGYSNGALSGQWQVHI
ncbi:GroES-like protein [Penicillium waksmanii]|uniref:GroES-like protein n=1 Tax=Penicillium waksmanii TaxID=69791 RepID=UPI002549291C|nr:GroES-like protein [Penicillium waksmanii]KAJ5966289.1 GroES-like protein [Penicillium waksmanii]